MKRFETYFLLLTLALFSNRWSVCHAFLIKLPNRGSTSWPAASMQRRQVVHHHTRIALLLFSWQDDLKNFFFAGEKKQDEKKVTSTGNNIDATTDPNNGDKDSNDSRVGTVVRIAARTYHPKASMPSSRDYTTRKDSVDRAKITYQGVEGDYNHYRTVALKSTPDRAVSILTTDVIQSLKDYYNKSKKYNIQDGDLGENILIDGLDFQFFKVGQRYQFDSEDGDSSKTTVLEITEPIEPCANLCKLPYINDDSLSPKDRIRRCQDFIEHLDRYDGYRGWYAKVICEGEIQKGSQLSRVTSTNRL